MGYNFPGMPHFAAREGVRPSLAARTYSTWFNMRLTDVLAQISTTAPEHRAAQFEEARAILAAIHAEYQTAIAAFDDVMANCPPAASPDDPPVVAADPFAAVRQEPDEDGEMPIPVAEDGEFTPSPEPRRRGRPRKDAIFE